MSQFTNIVPQESISLLPVVFVVVGAYIVLAKLCPWGFEYAKWKFSSEHKD